MLKRLSALLCALLLLLSAAPVSAEPAVPAGSYDFDLSFTVNADSFPALARRRAAGYASLVDRLGFRGRLSWSEEAASVDLDAELYFTDDPAVTYPFHLFGSDSRVFLTSPLINNETILFNMGALMEFAQKAKNTLGIPLPYFALLVPYSTRSALGGLIQIWKDALGEMTESREISPSQLRTIADLWADELQNNERLEWWVMALSSGSEAPYTVENEILSLPQLCADLANAGPLSVSVAPGSVTWQDAAGNTLVSRREGENASEAVLSLPASENGYLTRYSSSRQDGDRSFDFDISASYSRDVSADDPGGAAEEAYGSDADEEGGSEEAAEEVYEDEVYEEVMEEDAYGESGDYADYYEGDEDTSGEDFPPVLLDFHLTGSGLPRLIPDDSAFSLSVSILGALYPNYSFVLRGETKKDGAVTLSLTKPFKPGDEPVEILRCEGVFRPAENPLEVPDYNLYSLEGVYNVFSFNEQKLSSFTAKVLSPLVRSVFSFVAKAPTAACQSLLDDLTDLGILDMLLN